MIAKLGLPACLVVAGLCSGILRAEDLKAPAVVEVTDNHGVQRTRFPRFESKLAEVELRGHKGSTVGLSRKEHADAPLVGQPAADNSMPGFRVSGGGKRVAAVCLGALNSAGSERSHGIGGNAKVVFKLQQLDLG